jgi:cytoskeletal protein CcmA (bactofilin family)
VGLKSRASASDARASPANDEEISMVFGVRGRAADERPAPAATPAAGAGALTAFIDQGSEFEGKLSFKDTVRIDGHFRGEISSENTLIVGEPGEIEASIRSRIVIVSGTVDGPIVASGQLVLHKTAVVNGDVEVGSLAVEEGALLNGHVKMARAAAGGSAPKPKD